MKLCGPAANSAYKTFREILEKALEKISKGRDITKDR